MNRVIASCKSMLAATMSSTETATYKLTIRHAYDAQDLHQSEASLMQCLLDKAVDCESRTDLSLLNQAV